MSRYTCYECKTEHGEDNMVCYCAACYAKLKAEVQKEHELYLAAQHESETEFQIKLQYARANKNLSDKLDALAERLKKAESECDEIAAKVWEEVLVGAVKWCQYCAGVKRYGCSCGHVAEVARAKAAALRQGQEKP